MTVPAAVTVCSGVTGEIPHQLSPPELRFPGPGMLNVMVVPALPLAILMQSRSEFAPVSVVFVTTLPGQTGNARVVNAAANSDVDP